MLTWSREQFNIETQRLVAKLPSLDDDSFMKGWSLKQDSTSTTSDSYFLLHAPVQRDVDIGRELREEDVGDDDDDDYCDETVLQDEPEVIAQPPAASNSTNTSTSFTTWYFSIVYSDTWKSPILYFQVDLEGNPCPRSAMVKLLQQYSHSNRVQDPWEFLSHEEHPITRTSSFFLHPCRTMERLETLVFGGEGSSEELSSSCLILSWMSLILPSVGCALPSKTYQKLAEYILANGNSLEQEKE